MDYNQYATNTIPTILENQGNERFVYDLYSRLLKDRLIFITGEIEQSLAKLVIAQLLYLEQQDPHAEIRMYINSPGGSINDGMAIYDTMEHIKPDVSTIAVGLAASMGAFLLASGAKGKRYALPHTSIMIHQPLGGAQGQARDIEIAAERIVKTRNEMEELMSEFTGQTKEKIHEDSDRNNWMSAKEAKKYGLIDKVIE